MGMAKGMEKYMRGEKKGFLPNLFLYALSVPYGLGVGVRRLLYDAGVLKAAGLPCKVVSVGNITVGGTGKTPFVMHLAGFLKKKGKRPVILSRGYKGSKKGVCLVSDGKEALVGPEEAGDEPYLMAKRLKGVPVVTGADRLRTGRFAIERFSPDFIILDDGFQHIRLKRDLNLLLVDSAQGFGNGHLLPRGILREPLGGLKRADAVVVKGRLTGGGGQRELEGLDIPVIGFDYRASSVYGVSEGGERGPGYLKGKKAVAVAGIANPESFFKTLERLKADIVKKIVFPDHHAYTRTEVDALLAAAKDDAIIITTEKDGVKLKEFAGPDFPVYALGIDIEMDFKDERKLEGLFAPLLKEGR